MNSTQTVQFEHRVLPMEVYASLADYTRAGGGVGLTLAARLTPDDLIDLVNAAGLRGRGGGGFATGVKWRTVAEFASQSLATTVVVNAAEGEPGTFKDRAILRANPYAVLEGALIAARAVGAATVVVALKEAFTREVERVTSAIAEMATAEWFPDGFVTVFGGPTEYLLGEETALLEAIAGRPPFPRIAPPWRRGVTDVVRSTEDATSESGSAAPVSMAGSTDAPPTLVNNVETLANVPAIVARGPDWFRRIGTPESPGTVVCTVSGSTIRAGVAELPMGTSVSAAIEIIGGGVEEGRSISAILVGVSSPVLTSGRLDTPLSFEAMLAAGSGLGSAGLIVLDDDVDLVAAAAGVARFLAVESCGQCTPCKQDGLAIAATLDGWSRSRAADDSRQIVADRLTTVADGARCGLAIQQQTVVGSLLDLVGDERQPPTSTGDVARAPLLIAELIDIVDGAAVYDERFIDKQPDWTFADTDSGQAPVDRLGERRAADDPAAEV